nr:MAG TPA: hypothetical protein [Caudoviricetes sp.]
MRGLKYSVPAFLSTTTGTEYGTALSHPELASPTYPTPKVIPLPRITPDTDVASSKPDGSAAEQATLAFLSDTEIIMRYIFFPSIHVFPVSVSL